MCSGSQLIQARRARKVDVTQGYTLSSLSLSLSLALALSRSHTHTHTHTHRYTHSLSPLPPFVHNTYGECAWPDAQEVVLDTDDFPTLQADSSQNPGRPRSFLMKSRHPTQFIDKIPALHAASQQNPGRPRSFLTKFSMLWAVYCRNPGIARSFLTKPRHCTQFSDEIPDIVRSCLRGRGSCAAPSHPSGGVQVRLVNSQNS